MKTHDEVISGLMRRSDVRAEVGRIEREDGKLLHALLGVSKKPVELRLHLPPVWARRLQLWHGLSVHWLTGKHSPS